MSLFHRDGYVNQEIEARAVVAQTNEALSSE